MHGIDVSHHEGRIDWAAVKASGIDFAIIRSSRGKNVTDRCWQDNYAGATAAGIPKGAYHYFECGTKADFDAELQNFLAHLTGKTFELPVFLDLEDVKLGVVARDTLTSWALEAITKINAAGFRAGIYANAYWMNNKLDMSKFGPDVCIWCADIIGEIDYTGRVDIHQYSFRGTVPGIAGDGVDQDRSLCTDDYLIKIKNRGENMLDKFIAWLLSWVNVAIYVWGGQGQATDENDIRAHETSKTNADKAIALYRKRKAQGINPVIKFDCSGLGVCFLLANKILGYDCSAATLYNFCEPITANQIKRGDWVFHRNLLGKIHHIGYVVEVTNGVIYVVEAKGRVYGVVKTVFTTGAWNVYGRPKMFRHEIESIAPAWTVSRVLKLADPIYGGEDVRSLQYALTDSGYACGKIDGLFGAKTDAAVRAFQKSHALVEDGKAGKNTITALGGTWAG